MPGYRFEREIELASRLDHPGIVSLHAFTATNSLHYTALHAPSERVARLALLQAAAWVAEFRRGLDGDKAAFRIDDKGLRVDEVGRFLERARVAGRTKCDDVHEFKVTAAALEEASLVSSWVRPFVCAALDLHLPSPIRPDGARPNRIRDAIEVAAAR